MEEKNHLKTFYARHKIKPWESLVTSTEVEKNTVFCSLNNSSLVICSLQKLEFWFMIRKILVNTWLERMLDYKINHAYSGMA